MSLEAWLLAGLLVVTLGLFLWGRWRPDVVAIVALLAAAVLRIVPAPDVFAGFGHPAVITVAAVLVISHALASSGAVALATRPLERLQSRPVALLAGLTGAVALLSSFVNNVGALALLMPVAVRLSRGSGRPPSFYLMPLASGSLLGGMTTLIGTPPNLIVSGFREASRGVPFALFDFAPVGAAVAVAGVAFLVLWGWRLVPERKARISSEELVNVGPYLTEATVAKGSPAAGTALGDLAPEDVQILSIVRGKRRYTAPSADAAIREGDLLVMMGDGAAIQAFAKAQRLELVGQEAASAAALLESDEVGLLEVVVTPTSRLVGRCAVDMRLRDRFGVNLLGIAREGSRVGPRLGQARLRAGDVLLLQGDRSEVFAQLSDLGCLPLAERPIAFGPRGARARSLAIFALAIAAVTGGLLPAPLAFAIAATLMVVTKVLTVRQAYAAVDWPVIVLLGAMIPIGLAIDGTGLARPIAGAAVGIGHAAPGWVVLTVVLVATMFLSDLVNNAAAAVMMCPIALAVASGLRLSPDPFLLAVAIGASCAFLTPVGHQSNLLVMGPGGYRFGDYWRLGLALEALIVAVSVPALCLMWPLG